MKTCYYCNTPVHMNDVLCDVHAHTQVEPRIVTAVILQDWEHGHDSNVYVDWDSGATCVRLFGFYSDEINFYPSEFIGKTKEEALKIFHRKDVAYLQS